MSTQLNEIFLMRVLDFVMGQISNIGLHFIADTKPYFQSVKNAFGLKFLTTYLNSRDKSITVLYTLSIRGQKNENNL